MNFDFIFEFVVGIAPLVFFDLVFAGLYFLVLIPLLLFKQAAYAVLKRNFKSYFSNPTGYVFLALFVLLTSMSAFWPHEFFNANLANLDQLNSNISLIMLIFIPAITMSLWADERRLGTDELLLTLPATDFDIVIGKYLSAVSVFSVSLLFSQFCNFMVLYSLSEGSFDVGLFCTTYVGYWFMGLTMISLGMVASFLTNNLTLGFIMGIIVNAPFVLLEYSSAFITGDSSIQFLTQASIGMQFADFGRGVISLSSLIYFIMTAAVGIYLSMVLIGRRHWLGGKDGESLFLHYIARTIALFVIAGAATLIFVMNDFRQDFTANGTSSLSPRTIELVKNLDTDKPIRIEAFISESVPESHSQVKIDLINYLNEFRGLSGSQIDVLIYDGLEPFDEIAEKAEQQFNIQPRSLISNARGAIKQEQVILGAAIQCGLEKVVIPFFDNGIPVEYELVRSLCTVTDQKRKRVGVLQTDAQLFGGIQQSPLGGFSRIPRQEILTELEKQYEVLEVNPSNPIDLAAYDVILAVQPSSMTQPQLNNLLTAIREGMPTAIFDDPVPMTMPAPPISQPKQAMSQMAQMRRPPEQKCNIQQLWDLIGITMVGEKPLTQPYYDPRIIWQDYNPYPKFRQLGTITPEWVFIDPGMSANPLVETLRQSPYLPKDGGEITPGIETITNDLKQLLFLFPGSVEKKNTAPNSLYFVPLATTFELSGTLKMRELRASQGQPELIASKREHTGQNYTISAWVEGVPASQVDSLQVNQKKEDEEQPAKAASPIKVAFTADIDLLASMFVTLRANKDETNNLRFDNTNFVLNLLDMLAEDSRFVTIRSRSPVISRLKMVDTMTENAREASDEQIKELAKKYDDELKEKNKEINQPVEKLQDEIDQLQRKQLTRELTQDDVIRFNKMQRTLALQQSKSQKDLELIQNRLKKELEESQQKIQRDLDRMIVKTQNNFKFIAVALPPIPPILIGIIVFVIRRLKEREGLSKDRIVK